MCNSNRLGNNLPMYINSIVPEHLPGGGGFSIMQFTLENLYTMHQHVRNWWTTSNTNLPLIRYLKCKFKIYQSEDTDIVFRYQRHPPFESTQLSYPTTQPSVLMMLNRTILIPSKKTRRIRKGYRKITILPPSLMQNKWYFQQQIATMPLLVTYTTAASFDHYFISTQATSDNVTVPCLNTNIFQNREFGKNNAYSVRSQGTLQVWLWASDYEVDETEQPPVKSLILLSDTKNFTEGDNFESAKKKNPALKWDTYKANIITYAGNPFHKSYLSKTVHEHYTFYQSTGDYLNVVKNATNENIESTSNPAKATDLVKLFNPLIYYCRYNPNTDKGDTNNTYLLKNYQHEHGWDPYPDTKLELNGFPLYINWWGFLDFQKQQHRLTNIDTSTIFVTTSKVLHPDLPAYVPLCTDFIEGRSPYEQDVNPLDIRRWYPMVQYQEPAINNLLKCGPGTAKVEPKNTVEIKCEYNFQFKIGGNPAPMVDLKNPTDQPTYITPNNIQQTNSLQDPNTPAELFLYNFDQRRGYLTDKATKRIQKDWKTKQTVFTDATTTGTAPPILQQSPQTSEDETSEEEKEGQTLFTQLLKQRRKQQLLKYRMKQLLKSLQT